MIIVIGGIKGGSGKTTIATNLATIRAANGRKVLLIDTDDQRTTLDWFEQRSSLHDFSDQKLSCIFLSGNNIHKQISQMSKDYDDVIIDVGGRDTSNQRSALLVADRYILPFQPSSFDIWTIGTLLQIIQDLQIINPKLKTLYILNRVLSGSKDNNQSIEILEESPLLIGIPLLIGNRKAFRNAAAEGLGVAETKIRDDKAINEMIELHRYIYEISMEYLEDIKRFGELCQ